MQSFKYWRIVVYRYRKPRNKTQRNKPRNTPHKQRKATTSKIAKIKFKKDTEISKGIKKALSELSEHFEATIQDVLFVTMKEFTNEYKTDSTIQYFHYLESVKPEKLVNMLNFLELTRQ